MWDDSHWLVQLLQVQCLYPQYPDVQCGHCWPGKQAFVQQKIHFQNRLMTLDSLIFWSVFRDEQAQTTTKENEQSPFRKHFFSTSSWQLDFFLPVVSVSFQVD